MGLYRLHHLLNFNCTDTADRCPQTVYRWMTVVLSQCGNLLESDVQDRAFYEEKRLTELTVFRVKVQDLVVVFVVHVVRASWSMSQ